MSRRAWLAFAAMSLIWGVPYLFIKIAVDGGVTPLALAWARVTLGAMVLLGLAWRAGTLGSVRGHLRWLVALAIAEISIPFPLIAFGEQRVTSSLAAIMIAAVPLVGALLGSRAALRTAGRRRDRGIAADPGGLVAVDRRAVAAVAAAGGRSGAVVSGCAGSGQRSRGAGVLAHPPPGAC